MSLFAREKNNMRRLLLAANDRSEELYTLIFPNGDTVIASIDVYYETDNGLDLDDEKYEEYYACAMRVEKIIEDKSKSLAEGKLIEINYRNYPLKIIDSQGNII